MKRIVVALVLFLIVLNMQAQNKNLKDYSGFRKMFDSLNVMSDTMLKAYGAENRTKVSYNYLNLLEQTLKDFPDFDYPFDSLKNISIVGDDNGKFRIFSWELLFAPNKYRHLGIIQYHKEDGSQVVQVLNDYSDNIKNVNDTVCTPNAWFGCFYYKVHDVRYKGKHKYYLFGWDMNNGKSYKKLIDVLYFDNDKPKFGSRDFVMKGYGITWTRFILEYQKHSSTTLNYDENLKLIVFDYMLPIEQGEGNDKEELLLPDGSYNGFKYKKGRWILKEKLFNQVSKTAPVGR